MADPSVGPYLNQKSTDRSRDRTIDLLLEISRVLQRLSQAGVPAIPLKGPLLAARLIGNPTFREARDIDLLIPRDRIDQAQAALSPEYLPDARVRREWARRENHEVMKPVAGGRMIELHWQLLHPMTGAVIPESEPWDSATRQTAAGIRHLTLDPAVEIVVISAHAAHHFGFRLHWMCDVAALLLKADSASWQSALEIAARWRVRRAMLTAIRAASLLLDLPLSPALAAQADHYASDRVARWMVRRLLAGECETPSQFSVWPRRPLIFDGPIQMATATANILFTPLPEDRKSAGLPPWADPLTGLLRPLFILRRALARRQA